MPGNPMPIYRSAPVEIWGGGTPLLDRAAPSARLAALAPTITASDNAPLDTTTAALAPTTLAADNAPPVTSTAATPAPSHTPTAATLAPPTLTHAVPSTSAWQQSIVRNSITNNPDNDKDNARLPSLDGELRALALQREKIESRLKYINPEHHGTGKEDGSGGSDFISVDEVRSLKRRCGKIRNRERDLNNRLRKFREGNSQRDARTVACKGVRDQLQVREGETQREKQPDAETIARKEVRDQLRVREGDTQREKQPDAETIARKGVRDQPRVREGDTQRKKRPDAETCGQRQLREGATQRGTSLPASEPSGDTNRNQRSEERRVGKECRSRWSPYH